VRRRKGVCLISPEAFRGPPLRQAVGFQARKVLLRPVVLPLRQAAEFPALQVVLLPQVVLPLRQAAEFPALQAVLLPQVVLPLRQVVLPLRQVAEFQALQVVPLPPAVLPLRQAAAFQAPVVLPLPEALPLQAVPLLKERHRAALLVPRRPRRSHRERSQLTYLPRLRIPTSSQAIWLASAARPMNGVQKRLN